MAVSTCMVVVFKSLVLVSFSLIFTSLSGIDSDFFIVLLESCQVFTGLGEFTFFHALSDIPVHKGTLGVHEIKLVVQTSPSFSNGSGVGQHAHSSLHLGQISTWDRSRGLVVDANLEASGTPVHKLDGALGLDGSNGSIDVLGHDISTIQHAAGHVLAVARVTLHHLVGRLETGVSDFSHAQLLVVCFLGRNDGGIGHQGEMDSRVWHQVGLELGKIHIEGTIESEGGSDGRHNLTNETVEIGIGRSLDVQVPAADIVDSLVVYHEGAVRVLQGSVGGED